MKKIEQKKYELAAKIFAIKGTGAFIDNEYQWFFLLVNERVSGHKIYCIFSIDGPSGKWYSMNKFDPEYLRNKYQLIGDGMMPDEFMKKYESFSKNLIAHMKLSIGSEVYADIFNI